MLNRDCQWFLSPMYQSNKRKSKIEHKFIIEVTLKHVGPTADAPPKPPFEGVPQAHLPPQGVPLKIDPRAIQALLPQLANILGSVNPQGEQGKKPEEPRK